MRYILDNDGYIYDIAFGSLIECELGSCTEYTGEVPSGYGNLLEWADNANIRSYKIVDGNLVYDASRDYKLQILYEQEENDNTHVTRKEMGMTSTEEINPYTELFPSNQSAGGYITSLDAAVNKVGNFPTEKVNLSLLETQELDLIELEFIGNNFLPNTATSNTNNGITYTQNKDKTIKISGTSTDISTLNLAGTDTSVRNILTFKENEEYLLFGLEGLNLEFYRYDGTDRTLIGTYTDGDIINFDADTNVTQIVLKIESGVTIDTTIKPCLILISTEYPCLKTKIAESGEYAYSNVISFFTSEKYQIVINNIIYTVTIPDLTSTTADIGAIYIDNEQKTCRFLFAKPLSAEYVYVDCDFYYEEFSYEEYKNNTTLIDLAGNEFAIEDKIIIEDNQIILVKNGAVDKITDEEGNEIEVQKEDIYLGDVVMPRTYTPYTHAYCHQKVFIDFEYKDPRNVDIKKINLKGLLSITDIETEYNFTSEDYTKVQNYIMGEDTLTDEEIELYDINGDGVITSYDYLMIKQMVDGTISNKITGTLEINSTKSKRTIVLRDKNGKIQTSLGLNGITTPSLSVGGISINKAFDYSNSETVVGTWVDGKPLYRKVVYVSSMPSSSSATNIYDYSSEITDVDEIWIDERTSFITRSAETLGVNWFYSTTDYLRTYVMKSSNVIRCKSGASLSSFSAYITLLYTKTTD